MAANFGKNFCLRRGNSLYLIFGKNFCLRRGNSLYLIFGKNFCIISPNKSPPYCKNFYIHYHFAIIWQLWGDYVPPLMTKIFNNHYFTVK